MADFWIMRMRALWVSAVAVAAVGCTSDPTDRASVQIAMSNGAAGAKVFGQNALAPSELSVKITTAYVTEDKDPTTGTNIGRTQAIYASPNCDTFASSDDETNIDPNLGNCGLDVGLMSSSSPPQLITAGPSYIDLAAGQAAVDAALDAGRFAVDAGTYKYLRLDIGSNAPTAQQSGNASTLPAGTPMNFRFRAPGMSAPFELRRLMGIDVAFDPPLELTANMSVRVVIDYALDAAISQRPAGVTDFTCAPAVGEMQFCLEPSSLAFTPSIVIEEVAP